MTARARIIRAERRGPAVVRSQVYDAQLEGTITTLDEGIAMARERLAKTDA